MAIFTFTNVFITLSTLYILRRLYWETTTGQRRRNLAKQHGTLPATPYVSNLPWFVPTLGIDLLIANYRDYNARCLLEVSLQDFIDAKAWTIVYNIFGGQVFVTADPENVKQILATGFEVWSLGQERIEQMSSYLGHGVFTNEGKAWKHSREMLRPCFERQQVADVSLFEKHVKRLLALVPMDGETVDLQPLLHELSLDIATEFLFGRSTDSLVRGEESKEVERFVEAFEYCSNPFKSKNWEQWGYIGFFLPDRERKRSAKAVKDFADRIIDEEIAARKEVTEKASRYIFLDELLEATQDRTVIRSELLNILLAGRDTTAALLSNLLWELPRHQHIMTRLKAEIAEIVGTSVPTYAQLKDMKYLRACLNESQRLYPIVPSNSRCATRDTTLPRGGGSEGQSPILVPAGRFVAYNTYSMHRRPDIYGSDAHIFRPERWLEPGFRPGWAYIPFSGGPRVCIGQNFAVTEVMFVVVRILQLYEVEQRDFSEWREKLGITCTGDGGCKLGLKRRDGGEAEEQ